MEDLWPNWANLQRYYVEIDVKPEPRWKFSLILGDAKLKNCGMRVDVM